MAGLFDGMRTSTSGIRVHRILQEVVGQNVANASNENYSRQTVDISTMASQLDGRLFFGQGVKVDQIERVRNELLDGQLRVAGGRASMETEKLAWLQRVQTAFNEPSDVGINAALTNFWQGWSTLSDDPGSLAGRTEVLNRSENLARQLRGASDRLNAIEEDLDQSVKLMVNDINALTEQLAQINKDIFEIEAGQKAKANDLHDQRDAILDDLSEKVDYRAVKDTNGMVNVIIGGHPAVMGDKAEKIVAYPDLLDASQLALKWEWGDGFKDVTGGQLGAVLDIRETILPDFQQQLHDIASMVIEEVNAIYSNGVGSNPVTLMESRLGYEALGVNKSSDALNLVTAGNEGEIHLSFYDANNNLVRTQGILIDSGDSLDDIANKLNGIRGIQASTLSGIDNDGRLSIQLDTVSGENSLGEVSFSVGNNTGGFDSSGFLSLVGFDQTDKSTNASGVAPVIAGRDLSELQTQLGETTVAAVRTKALNISGTFTINAYETGTEDTPKTNGHHVQQFTIDVDSSDSIDAIMAKVNNLTANHGISMSFNGATNKLELTSTARTDAEGNVLLAGGTNYLRLSFANDYRYPAVVNDEAPTGYTGLPETSGLFGKLQMNTLFMGNDADSIDVESAITGASAVHSGFSLADGDNRLAQAINDLQHKHVDSDGQFTFGEIYGNYISGIGSDINKTENVSESETLLLEAYKAERDSVSGVNLDEELALMIQYQRSYEANARMFSTFSQMAEELMNLI